MDPLQIIPRLAGASGLIAALCNELKIARIVDAMVRWDPKQWKLSPGQLVTALVINILCGRKPLYKVHEFYEHRDLPVLLGADVTPENLNDDAFGRALDRLAEIDCKRLFQSIALSAVHNTNLQVRSVHADTTSISLQGEYEPHTHDERFLEEHPDKQLLGIRHGHSKQNRPDLKQFMIGLVVSPQGLPLLAETNDGNLSDKIWNNKILTEMQTCFLDPHGLVWIADSALITEKNLDLMAKNKTRFISRLPDNYKVAAEVKAAAWQEKRWIDLGNLSPRTDAARYQSASFIRLIHGQEYRLIVFRSSALDHRKEKKIQHMVVRERSNLEAAVKALQQKEFGCKQDAAQALESFLQEHAHALHTLQGHVVRIEKIKRGKGRPSPKKPPAVEVYHQLEISIDDPPSERIQQVREQESCFVLITSLTDNKLWLDGEILYEYKEQRHVEDRFRLLKHPLVTDGIFVKSTIRAESLAYVILIALLVAAYLELKVRAELASSKQLVELQGKRHTDRPTSKALLDDLSTLMILLVSDGKRMWRQLPYNLDHRQVEIIRLAGYTMDIYTTTPAGLDSC